MLRIDIASHSEPVTCSIDVQWPACFDRLYQYTNPKGVQSKWREDTCVGCQTRTQGMDHKVCTPLFELHPHSVLAHEAIYVNRFHAKMSRLMLCKVFHLRARKEGSWMWKIYVSPWYLVSCDKFPSESTQTNVSIELNLNLRYFILYFIISSIPRGPNYCPCFCWRKRVGNLKPLQ